MIFLFTYLISGIITGCIFLSWYIFTMKNSKENKQLRQDNKKLKTLLQEAIDKNNRLNCEKTELLKLINKLKDSNRENTSLVPPSYESIKANLQAQNNTLSYESIKTDLIKANLQTQNDNILMNLTSQLHLLAATTVMSNPYGCLNSLYSPYMPLSNPQYPYTWH